ncbi:hypothetical protein HNO91_18610 [Pseudomonas corrugata]|uniref:Uncharacterized protein n=1 Tax=Pseudomonas corrugata TaxID=47879 RepID=A0A7Y6DIC8_9PSED|nr:hypothetical protein [Pseudomonas corrugata]NUT88452.1 hypothetical protein [Pseudomonas corrugata]
MKRSVLLGLFVTASMLASSSFAAGSSDNLCDTNIVTLESSKTQVQGSDLEGQYTNTLQQAKANRAENTDESIKKCITDTTQMLDQIRKVGKDGKSS